MKKFIILIGILFAMQTQTMLMAQVTSGDVLFNVNLGSTLNLTIIAGGETQTVDFLTAADYNGGVTEGAGINTGTTNITVEATQNWRITIQAPDFLPINPLAIPIDNLGVYCVATGAHGFNVGGPCTCTCQIPGTALGLHTGPLELIGLGTGNMGDATDNAFTLHWEMGTKQAGNPNPMHTTSMFDQMANGDFGIGIYSTTATLTLIGL